MIDTESKTRTHFAQLGEENKQRCWNCVSLNIFVLNLSRNLLFGKISVETRMRSLLLSLLLLRTATNKTHLVRTKDGKTHLALGNPKKHADYGLGKKFLSKKPGRESKGHLRQLGEANKHLELNRDAKKSIFFASLLREACKTNFR